MSVTEYRFCDFDGFDNSFENILTGLACMLPSPKIGVARIRYRDAVELFASCILDLVDDYVDFEIRHQATRSCVEHPSLEDMRFFFRERAWHIWIHSIKNQGGEYLEMVGSFPLPSFCSRPTRVHSGIHDRPNILAVGPIQTLEWWKNLIEIRNPQIADPGQILAIWSDCFLQHNKDRHIRCIIASIQGEEAPLS